MTEPTGFEQIEVPQSSEADAAAEAQRRQLLEPDPDAVEWIYLHNRAGEWVARRVLRSGDAPEPEPSPPQSRVRKAGKLAGRLFWEFLGAMPWS